MQEKSQVCTNIVRKKERQRYYEDAVDVHQNLRYIGVINVIDTISSQP